MSAITLALAAAATVNAFLGETVDDKFPANPWEGKSDAERQADVDAAHKRNDDYLREFIASGEDARALPRIAIEAYAPPPATEDAATKRAELIVRGNVESTAFAPNPSGGLPIAISTVRVSDTRKGFAGAVVEVLQLGGPVAQEKGGAFAHLDTDEPLLPGDDVILLLEQADDGMMTAQPGTGIYFVRDGIIAAEQSNPFGDQMNGRAAGDVLASLTAGG